MERKLKCYRMHDDATGVVLDVPGFRRIEIPARADIRQIQEDALEIEDDPNPPS